MESVNPIYLSSSLTKKEWKKLEKNEEKKRRKRGEILKNEKEIFIEKEETLKFMGKHFLLQFKYSRDIFLPHKLLFGCYSLEVFKNITQKNYSLLQTIK